MSHHTRGRHATAATATAAADTETETAAASTAASTARSVTPTAATTTTTAARRCAALRRHSGQTVLVLTHSTVIESMLAAVFGMDFETVETVSPRDY